jgi:hypothetical protein
MTANLAVANILDELKDRYDGAPDSDNLWMGSHIRDLTALQNEDDQFIKAQAAVCRVINALAVQEIARAALAKSEGKQHLPDCWREYLIAECDLEEQSGPYRPVAPKRRNPVPSHPRPLIPGFDAEEGDIA